MSAADKSLEMPKASVRRIMKLNEEVPNISAEAVSATGKACELFIAQLGQLAMNEAVEHGRKTIKVEDIISVIERDQVKYEFLNDAFSSMPIKR